MGKSKVLQAKKIKLKSEIHLNHTTMCQSIQKDYCMILYIILTTIA